MISYCVTVYNEIEEIPRLLQLLNIAKESEDEIVVIQTYRTYDEQNSNHYSKIKDICLSYPIIYHSFYFQDNFADLKNYMNSKVSKNQKYIVNFDADEIMDVNMLKILRNSLIETDIDLIYLPRVNIVEGITSEDINLWSWKINENGWINWPDYQPRIYKNLPHIRWTGTVHESITGILSTGAVNPDGKVYISHIKTISKQRQQNQLYEKIHSKINAGANNK